MRPQSEAPPSAEERTTVADTPLFPSEKEGRLGVPEWHLGENVVVIPDGESELWEVFRGKPSGLGTAYKEKSL